MHSTNPAQIMALVRSGKLVNIGGRPVLVSTPNSQSPQRSYKIRPHSMSASCNPATDMCRVQGIMERDLANPAANTKSHDVASFDYSLTRSGEAFKISAETSSVSKLSDPSGGSNPLTTVQKGLERLLAQVSRIRQVPKTAPDGQVRPSAPISR